MSVYLSWAQSGVTFRANSTAYSVGARMQPAITDTSTNHAVAKRYVWECTTAGNSGAAVPAWSASYTPDTSTITDGGVTWTCRNPGYSSGSTQDWTFASAYASYTVPLLAAGDTLMIHYTSQEAANSSTQALAPTADDCLLISVDKDAANAYTPMGASGYLANVNNASLTSISSAAKQVMTRGLTLRYSGTSATSITVGGVDDGQVLAQDLHIELTAASANPFIVLGAASDARAFVSIKNLTISRAHASQIVRLGGVGEILGGQTAGAGAVTGLFASPAALDATGSRWVIQSFDCTGGSTSSSATLVTDGGVIPARVEFHDCILPSSYATLSGAGNVNASGLEVLLVNCKAGATTGIHQYANALGSALRNTTVTYNGEAFSWKIDAGSNATRNSPFVMPWMWGPIATGASITPKIEILRNDSTTALTDVEVWCERAAQVTAGSPVRTFVDTLPAYDSAGASLPTGAGLGAWAGESGTAWSGKLAPPACTPEGGKLAMRICVATTTPVYVAMGWDT